MTKAEAMKKFKLTKVLAPVNNPNACAKGTDLRNYDHPYSDSTKNYDRFEFLVQLTRFEDAEYGYGLYFYNTPKMSYAKAMEIHRELTHEWERPGRRAWNSINLIGFDENGQNFSAVDWREA